MEDAELLQQYAEEGSEQAFSELVRRHANLVHSVAMRRLDGDFHGAKDVTQTVFSLLARQAASLVEVKSLSGWLYVVAVHSAANVTRGAKRRRGREEKAEIEAPLMTQAEPSLEWERLRPVLDLAMLGLKKADREALIWRFFDAQPFSVIGQRLGMSENTARMRISRALERMGSILRRHGIGSSATALGAMLAAHSVTAAPAQLAESVAAGALAAAASGVAPAAGGWAIAGSKLTAGFTGLLWITAALSLTAIGWTAYELLQARAVRSALAADTASYEAEGRHLAAMRRASRPAEGGAARPMSRSARAAADPGAEFRTFMAAYPQIRPWILSSNRLLAGQIYGSFFRSAHLTPFQIERFEDCVADKWLESETISPEGMVLSREALPAPQALKAILGGSGLDQLRDYSQSASAHYWASWIAGRLPAYSELTQEQSDRMAQALARGGCLPAADDLSSSNALAVTDWNSVDAELQAALPAAAWKAAEPHLLNLQLLGLVVQGRSAQPHSDP